jgi:antitoxin component HigA of HigAB toxin-antitoxin module
MILSTAAIKNIEKQVFTPSQYHAAMSEIENYISRGFENLNEKEANHLDELSDKVHEYESHKYPMPMANSVSGLLQGYMMANNLNRVKLGSVLKVSGSTISDILNGKKGISFPLAVRMHQILKIDAEELLNVKLVSSSPVRRVGFSQSQKASAGQIKLSYRKRSTANKSAVKKAAKKK